MAHWSNNNSLQFGSTAVKTEKIKIYIAEGVAKLLLIIQMPSKPSDFVYLI